MKKAFLLVALLAAVPATSLAADSLFDEEVEETPLKKSFHLYPFVEDFTWKEIFQGTQVAKEKGELYGAGATATFESGASVYRLKADYFQGKMDVDGTTSLGFPWSTEVNYYGAKLEGDAGLRVPIGRASVVPHGGLGYVWWRKDFENSPTTVGWLERWHTFYLKAGAVAEYDLGRGIVPYLEAAVRFGIFTNNSINYNGARVSMNPGGRITPYAEAGLKLSVLKGSVYYERVEFAQSDAAPAPGLPPGYGLAQPEVRSNRYGARVGIAF